MNTYLRYRHVIILSMIAVTLSLITSCNNPPHAGKHPEWSYKSVVYEMNLRQYTPEGTFASAERQLPRLKELGVDIIWLMPIYPIGEKERKGSLGSYYAIADYEAVNPEFGDMADFRHFLKSAHKEGFKVILDWVANHTSPDARWITGKPADWYRRDSCGNTVVQYDWTDIAPLNYDNADMRAEMVKCMRFWLEKGIDGFRCDVAYEIPEDFWANTISSIKKDYPDIYMLAEGEKTWLHKVGFDATYTWKLHHLLNGIAQGKADADSLRNYIDSDLAAYGHYAFRLMFTSNHDENSWAGTEFTRMGDAAKVMAVLTFTLPQGQPLIYTGQEMGWNHSFKFFEKDPIDRWITNDYTSFYRDLIRLKHLHPALYAGEKGGTAEFFDVRSGDSIVNDKVLAFRRIAKQDTITVIANLSPETMNLSIPEAEENSLFLPAWGWKIKE